jgi:hypothetical protein
MKNFMIGGSRGPMAGAAAWPLPGRDRVIEILALRAGSSYVWRRILVRGKTHEH